MAYEIFISDFHHDQPLRLNIITTLYDGEIIAGTNLQP